jgi:hypothetical protein
MLPYQFTEKCRRPVSVIWAASSVVPKRAEEKNIGQTLAG